MSVSYQSDYARAVQRKIIWDQTRTKAASLLALGHPKTRVADAVGVHRNTITAWCDDPDFAAEVDRLSTMMDVASRAERLREAMRVLRSMRDEDGILRTEKDALDWLKYAQSETDGAKIDISKLAELLAGEYNGDSGPSSQPGVVEVETNQRLLPETAATAVSDNTENLDQQPDPQ